MKQFLKLLWKSLVWIVWEFPGFRAIYEKIIPPLPSQNKRPAPTFFLWFVSIYIALFGLSFLRYEYSLEHLENRIIVIIAQLGTPARKEAFGLIARTQNTKIPIKPVLFSPWSLYCSIRCDGKPDDDNVALLAGVIQSHKKNLAGVYLAHTDLANANLSDANLSDANLSDANLSDAYLPGANMSGADLSKANFLQAHMRQVNLSGAYLPDANFKKAVLHESNLSKTYLRGANFSEADLSKAYLAEANLRQANLLKAILNTADLSGVNLREANLGDADLRMANLIKADISTALNITQEQIDQACLDDTTKLSSDLKYPVPVLQQCKAFWPNDFK